MASPLAKNLRKLTLAFAAAAALSGCVRHEEPAAPLEECVPTSDAQQFEQKFPALYGSFKKIEALPYSGQSIASHMKDPLNGIQTCSGNNLVKGAVGQFDPETGQLSMRMDNIDGKIYTHEMFHAGQYVNGALAWLDAAQLTQEDSLQGNMLIEASAVGYSFVVYKEMSKTDPAAYEDFTATWYSFGMRARFDAAYARALPSGEEKALEAGGKAVVEGLLSGENQKWAQGYTERSLKILRNSDANARLREGYAADRAEAYRAAGEVSPTMNLTPDWMLAKNPERNIARHLAKTGNVSPS